MVGFHDTVPMQGLLLTTYLKFLIADPGDANLRSLAEEVFQRYSRQVSCPCWHLLLMKSSSTLCMSCCICCTTGLGRLYARAL